LKEKQTNSCFHLNFKLKYNRHLQNNQLNGTIPTQLSDATSLFSL